MAQKNRSIIINGVGSMFAKDPANSKLVSLGSLQTLRFDFAITEDPIYGGDGWYPIDYLIRDKNVTVTATNAKFDLNTLRLMTGAELGAAVSADQYVWALNKIGTVIKAGSNPNYTYEVDVSGVGTVFAADPAFSVMVMETGEALAEDAVTPATGEFVYDSQNHKLLFYSDMENKMVMYSCKVAKADMTLAEGKKTDLPITVRVIHQGIFKQKDNTYQGVETEIKLAKPSGTFTIDFARATASTNNLVLNMIDPEDGTCRLWTIKRFEVAAPPCQ